MLPSCEKDGAASELAFHRRGFLSMPEASQIYSCYQPLHWWFTLPKIHLFHTFAWFTSFLSFKSLKKLSSKESFLYRQICLEAHHLDWSLPRPWEGPRNVLMWPYVFEKFTNIRYLIAMGYHHDVFLLTFSPLSHVSLCHLFACVGCLLKLCASLSLSTEWE